MCSTVEVLHVHATQRGGFALLLLVGERAVVWSSGVSMVSLVCKSDSFPRPEYLTVKLGTNR